MLPKIILHNAVSLDGAIKGFPLDIAYYYQIAGAFQADFHFSGSDTCKIGVDLYIEEVPEETEADLKRPGNEENTKGFYWVIPDSRGKLKGLLHLYRNFEHARDAIILISQDTPQEYIQYLEEREYDYIVAGKDHVDYKEALQQLKEKYGFKTGMVDSGGVLSSLLLEQQLVDEISIMISPSLVGHKEDKLFRTLNPIGDSPNLTLKKIETLEKDYVWLQYEVNKNK
jgi:2,5-diamino-6-(ribosylamino)-4(3H)-pyrimidinone 5'-phosphate reductase